MREDDPVRFVLREARLIDEKRFDEWYELFTDDAFYWVRSRPGRPIRSRTTRSPTRTSCFKLRIERLKLPTAYSQKPASRCLHVMQARSRASDDARGEYLTRTAFIYTETRGDESQRYAAVAWHTLVRSARAAHPAQARRHPERRRRPALDPALPVSAAIVTGGSAGIGRAVEALLEEGYRVISLDLQPPASGTSGSST